MGVSCFPKSPVRIAASGLSNGLSCNRIYCPSRSIFQQYWLSVAIPNDPGRMFVFESTRIREGGPILHTHYDTDEWWYILQGEFLIKVGETTYNAKAGEAAFHSLKT